MPILLSLGVVTGIVDAVSYLRLGHVFVANMTGNVVFFGFALGARIARSSGVSIDAVASAIAVVAFVVGARNARVVLERDSRAELRTLADVLLLETVLVFVSALVAAAGPVVGETFGRYAVVSILALALGAQNAVAKKLAIPDLTTTVLTMTITAIGTGGPGLRRRVAAVAAMFAGALLGAAIVVRFNVTTALVLAAVTLGLIAILARRSPPNTASG